MSSQKIDPATWTHVRPTEIKTYHRTTYDRISPSNTLNGKGKTVLITAGAVGIGFAIAESFAKAGVERLVLIQRRQDALETAKQAIESKYPNTKVTPYAASVTDYDRISAIMKEVGKIDVLVPNAAMSHPFVPSKDVTVDDFKATFDTNVVGAFHIIKEFLAVESSGPRQVILTSSAAGQITSPGNVGYGPSKAAASQLVQHFAAENLDTNVTIQAFHPGVIYTTSVAKLAPEGAFEWEDLTLPGDFAVWLASPEAEFLAGRFVWAQWDVDELLGMKERIAANPALLTTTVVL
ncbi:hypothetical protein M409DRAFT_70713 [Zasmidium cellare ATCC 36951]|uniref:Ketoreductase domain-containing protein n=1 Tax=Zasmidium cellare ATCC 36951 TaxID=1080233 RepID=A0A6A6C1F0_ZASCE|nr:uncharacterized protein M409DRAFT_70713 [Zasmidium cellare ATCC 36951]KAF2159980.1 hypothetical protein M409DRAFT_70713 [Zasmidium cellare ATCC 36951]